MFSSFCQRFVFESVSFGVLLLLATPAKAQRKFRLTIGGGPNEIYTSYEGGSSFGGGTSRGEDAPFAFTLSYDVSRIGVSSQDNLPLTLYYDSFRYINFLGGSNIRVTGIGLSVRAEDYGFYYGGGLGLYQTHIPEATFAVNNRFVERYNFLNPGVKLFCGLQDSSSAFLELAYTALPDYISPGLTFAIGLRL